MGMLAPWLSAWCLGFTAFWVTDLKEVSRSDILALIYSLVILGMVGQRQVTNIFRSIAMATLYFYQDKCILCSTLFILQLPLEQEHSMLNKYLNRKGVHIAILFFLFIYKLVLYFKNGVARGTRSSPFRYFTSKRHMVSARIHFGPVRCQSIMLPVTTVSTDMLYFQHWAHHIFWPPLIGFHSHYSIMSAN